MPALTVAQKSRTPAGTPARRTADSSSGSRGRMSRLWAPRGTGAGRGPTGGRGTYPCYTPVLITHVAMCNGDSKGPQTLVSRCRCVAAVYRLHTGTKCRAAGRVAPPRAGSGWSAPGTTPGSRRVLNPTSDPLLGRSRRRPGRRPAAARRAPPGRATARAHGLTLRHC